MKTALSKTAEVSRAGRRLETTMFAFFMMSVVLVRSPVLSAFATHDCYRGGVSNPDASLENFAFIGSSVLGAGQQGSLCGRGISRREVRGDVDDEVFGGKWALHPSPRSVFLPAVTMYFQRSSAQHRLILSVHLLPANWTISSKPRPSSCHRKCLKRDAVFLSSLSVAPHRNRGDKPHV